MHEVIDTFFKFLQEKNINIDMLSEEKLKEIIYDIIQEKLSMSKNYIFTSTPKYVILTERLSKVVYESITYLVKIASLKYMRLKLNLKIAQNINQL